MLCFSGALMGTLVGVLPGLGPVGALSILLPVTMGLTPVQAVVTLAGIYYGAMYGGSTTSILLNIPGEAASVVTCIDGYQMARKGRAGPALGICAFGSFIGGTIGVFLLTILAMPLIKLALRFGPPEYFSLMVIGIATLTFLSSKSTLKSLTAGAMGMFLGTIGSDPVTGVPRFTFRIQPLMDGIGLVPVAMGLFGISEILINLESGLKQKLVETNIRGLLPTLQDWKDCKWPIIRGSFIGFLLGILPGGGALLASFTSYAIEKRLSKHPEKFGQGTIEGVAGPETANNAGAQGNFVPLLTFALPCNAVMAMLLAIFMIHGLNPGPLLLKQHPEVFWGLIASMYLGNFMLLVLNLPLIGVWVQILKIPYSMLFPFVILFCLVGAYSLNNNVAEVIMMVIFGVLGYFMKKFEYDPAVMLLALVLGPMMENAFRQSLLIYRRGFSVFLERPISLVLLCVAGLLLIYPLFRKRKRLPIGDSEGA
jgi:putative tricarboxylic transport membrane protein